MAWNYLPLWFLTIATLVCLFTTYTAVVQSPGRLSPQGCRMSYMYPSFVLQSRFDSNWTRLAQRYTLWLYRERNLDSEEPNGLPILFIPGNAGSSRQVRSIASSAANQYYIPSHQPNQELANFKPLDFFTVDFNEDFSALHGPTLLSQREYTQTAISYILSLYPSGTQIIIMGHSMGGIVAVSHLPSPDVSAIITMSTPHSLPPARLDRRMEAIYSTSWNALKNDTTPILSICGGATDLMIPSETCSMQHRNRVSSEVGWRKTIFTTCMEGVWTGVGHQEMVWCHQVRWRVARAALELGGSRDVIEKAATLDRWFRNGVEYSTPTVKAVFLNISNAIVLSLGHRLVLKNVTEQSNTYILPVAQDNKNYRFSLFVSRGILASLSAHHTSGLQVSVFQCAGMEDNCRTLEPSTLKLLPSPVWGQPFPVPQAGTDESEGIVYFEADFSVKGGSSMKWIAVSVQGRPDRRSWLVGGIDEIRNITVNAAQSDPLWKTIDIRLDPSGLSTSISFPQILASSLVVYRLEIPSMAGNCKAALLPPLLLHKSAQAESHFYPTDGKRPILIHTHSSGPFVYTVPGLRHGIILQAFSSGECGISELSLTVDWWGSLSNWGLRYWSTVFAWSMSIVGSILLHAWHVWEQGDPFPTLDVSLSLYIRNRMLPLSFILLISSCFPADAYLLLGNAGEIMLAPLAPILLVFATGCVAFTYIILQTLLKMTSRVLSLLGRIPDDTILSSRTRWSLILILVLVGSVIPSQVAFIVCFFLHFLTCATQFPSLSASSVQVEAFAQKSYILLIMFWLLPLVLPVLAVWVRTLATAGLTTPLDGDHNVFDVSSFLLFVDFASNTVVPPFERTRSKLNARLTFLIISCLVVVPLLFGGRYTYAIYTASNVVITYLCIIRIGRRLWRI